MGLLQEIPFLSEFLLFKSIIFLKKLFYVY